MPPIPTHLDAPITPEKPQGVTPSTTTVQPPSTPPIGQSAPAYTPATTTSTPSALSYPAVRPGQAAVPAPTPFIQPQPTRTQTASSNDGYGPPPPQPGAVPTANISPPPTASELAALRRASLEKKEQQQPQVTTMPPQMAIPPPGQNISAGQSTTTASVPASGPTTVNLGLVSPGGYKQDTMAQEMSAAQRASLDGSIAAEGERRPSFSLPGIIGGTKNDGVEDEGVIGKMKGWLGAAGQKIVETEEEVWRRVGGKK